MLSKYSEIIDKYQKVREEREKKAAAFIDGTRPYMIFGTPPGGKVWGDIRTPEVCFQENLKYVESSLDVMSDHLPVMEPWFGTGVFANMYGCPYVWRDGSAPAVHYKYHSIDDIEGIKKPRWQDSEIANLVMDTIKYFKSQTGDAIPIVLTDTQSASDTATLVLDSCEIMMGCLSDPEITMEFMNQINELTIEFSKAQEELIGDAIMKPGHIMLSNAGLSGISISDDNLAVASPNVNKEFNLPLNEKFGQAMGGVAIHSCGKWQHSMGMIKDIVPSCVAIDCALDKTCDPNPNDPEAVRDAFAGTGIHVHARFTGETKEMCNIAKRLLHLDLKLILHPNGGEPQNYQALNELLSDFYGCPK